MIDNASFVIQNYSNKEFEELTDRLDIYCPIDSEILHFDFHNIRVNYYPNINKLRIKNSLHCLYNIEFGVLKQAVNYNDFTFFEFQVILEYFSKIIFLRPLEDFLVSTNFEVGLNVQLENISPFELTTRYMSCGTTKINEFFTVAPAGLKGKPIQRMCYMSDYKIKFYDKSKQSRLVIKDILRYEIVYTELRKIRHVLELGKTDKLNLSMLNNQNIWSKFFGNLMTMYDSIRKIPLINEPFSINNISNLHGYCNKIMAEDIRNTMNIHTYNKHRAEMKKVYKSHDINPGNYHLLVRQKLVNKFNSLIDIHQFQGV